MTDTVAWVALGVAVVAAAFSGWQAWISHRARRSAADDALIEWEPAEWIDADTIELRSKGPDDAFRVWGRITIDGKPIEGRARRIRQGEALRFTVPHLGGYWLHLLSLHPGSVGTQYETAAFHYGLLVRFRTRLGNSGVYRWDGPMMHKFRSERPIAWQGEDPRTGA
jgi:hypothetical protein